jgi:hypothetical protein
MRMTRSFAANGKKFNDSNRPNFPPGNSPGFPKRLAKQRWTAAGARNKVAA